MTVSPDVPRLVVDDLSEAIRMLRASGLRLRLERQGLTGHVHLGHGPGLCALVGRDDGEFRDRWAVRGVLLMHAEYRERQ